MVKGSNDKPQFTYSGVTVFSSERVFVIGVMDALLEEQPDHSFVFRWREGEWGQIPLTERAISSCPTVDKVPTLVSVCANGEVELLLPTGTATETVDPTLNGPNDLLNLRAARTIGGKVHAAGMVNHVYRRSGPGKWQTLGDELFANKDDQIGTTGILCIDGFGLDQVFGAGYGGQIWYYNGSAWQEQDSPTDIALTTMRCGLDKTVYVAGLAGVLLQGNADRWHVIEQQLTEDDFWGSAIFQGIPYFATNKAIYRLVNSRLERVPVETKRRITTRFLDCDSSMLWSVGDKHIFLTRDGVNWEPVPDPS